MADLFEIVGVDTKIKVPKINKEFEFADPDYDEKIALMKQMRDLSKTRGQMDILELLQKDREFAKRYVKLYLPKLTDADIKKMGTHAFDMLQEAVTGWANKKLGAYVRKIESEKKDSAT
jgi:hypothetical protein